MQCTRHLLDFSHTFHSCFGSSMTPCESTRQGKARHHNTHVSQVSINPLLVLSIRWSNVVLSITIAPCSKIASEETCKLRCEVPRHTSPLLVATLPLGYWYRFIGYRYYSPYVILCRPKISRITVDSPTRSDVIRYGLYSSWQIQSGSRYFSAQAVFRINNGKTRFVELVSEL
jgi:hypothetical protein